MLPVIDYETGRCVRPCVLLLGYFDGVHVGHRRLISRAKEEAAARGLCVGIMTFYGGKSGRQIFDFSERLYLFESLGIDFVYAARFDEAFRVTEGQTSGCLFAGPIIPMVAERRGMLNLCATMQQSAA